MLLTKSVFTTLLSLLKSTWLVINLSISYLSISDFKLAKSHFVSKSHASKSAALFWIIFYCIIRQIPINLTLFSLRVYGAGKKFISYNNIFFIYPNIRWIIIAFPLNKNVLHFSNSKFCLICLLKFFFIKCFNNFFTFKFFYSILITFFEFLIFNHKILFNFQWNILEKMFLYFDVFAW